MREAVIAGHARPCPWRKQYAMGSLLWLCVLLALEPGNLLRWHGVPPSWSQEALRLGMASLLGGSCGPAIFWLVRVRPVRMACRYRRLAWHIAAIAGLSLALLALANIMAWLFLNGPGPGHLPLEIAANLTLLAGVLAAIDLAAHVINPAAESPGGDFIDHIAVKAKGGTFQLPLDQVESIRAQENYVALHTGADTHLVRGTLSAFCRKLDPGQFIRVHRSTVINRAHILRTRAAGNGKVEIVLRSGGRAIASRAYSSALRDT